MCPGSVRGVFLLLAVQRIVTLFEAAIAHMRELALLIAALALVEAEANLGTVWCGSNSLTFRLPLVPSGFACLALAFGAPLAP